MERATCWLSGLCVCLPAHPPGTSGQRWRRYSHYSIPAKYFFLAFIFTMKAAIANNASLAFVDLIFVLHGVEQSRLFMLLCDVIHTACLVVDLLYLPNVGATSISVKI